ncbi:MAG: 50S ribosomal protein L4 [Chitinophagaceae bacterium]|nr:50S ribosomal protein L4 [Chitinophagaceae bacterium]
MSLKKFKPITAGTRWRIGNSYAEVTTNVPEKSLIEAKPRTGGRNTSGHLTMRYRGGGHKKKYRIIDFKRNKSGVATVESIQYDPNRTAFIALVVEDITMEKPKTKQFMEILGNLKVADKKALFITPDYNDNVELSLRNAPSVMGVLLSDINTYDIVNSEVLVLTESAAKIFAEEEGSEA